MSKLFAREKQCITPEEMKMVENLNLSAHNVCKVMARLTVKRYRMFFGKAQGVNDEIITQARKGNISWTSACAYLIANSRGL